MKGLLIDVHNAKIQEVEVSELDDYYKWIGCENIDITSRKIGGRIYDIICDDEGFFMSQCWYLLLILNRMQC